MPVIIKCHRSIDFFHVVHFAGHCSTNGEYFDAYPMSPVMVAGYPAPVYYPFPYAPIDWNGVGAPMYPMVATLPMEDPTLLSPELQVMVQVLG